MVVSVLAAGLLGIGVMFLTDQIVAGRRLELAEQAARHYKEAYDTLKIPVEKFGLMTDLTGAVIRATQTAAVLPPAGPHI